MTRTAENAMLADLAAKVPARQAAKDRQGPTPEQHRHGVFKVGDVVDKQANGVTITIGKAYRRQPLFETLAKGNGSGIDAEGLKALRYYRAKHDQSEQSLTRCALDVQGRGGGGTAPLPRGIDGDTPLDAMAQGLRILDRLEQAMGAVVDTMRAVAIEDRSYSDVAISRWGSRKQSWIEQPKGKARKAARAAHVEKIVPKSGRHREAVRQEFLLALRRLVQAVQLLTVRTTELRPKTRPVIDPTQQPHVDSTEVRSPAPSMDPSFLNDQGYLREWDEIAEIIRERTA